MTAAVVAGLGHALPATVVTNEELARRLETSDAWIRRRTGITSRRVAGPAVRTSDLAAEAGANALKSAGTAEVDMVLLATTTPDRPAPASAPEVAYRLGLGPVAACDVAAVCSGFGYGLAMAAGLIAGRITGRVLVIGAEIYSRIVDPADRASAVLFGDGAGALVLRAGRCDEPGAVTAFDLGSDGGGADLICRPEAGRLTMRGQEVYRAAVPVLARSCRVVLERAGWRPADVDAFVPHQANRRLLDAVADRLELPADRRRYTLDTLGNTAAASIPLTLAHAAAAGSLRAGHRVLLTSFGGGLTWASATLTWPDVVAVGPDVRPPTRSPRDPAPAP